MAPSKPPKSFVWRMAIFALSFCCTAVAFAEQQAPRSERSIGLRTVHAMTRARAAEARAYIAVLRTSAELEKLRQSDAIASATFISSPPPAYSGTRFLGTLDEAISNSKSILAAVSNYSAEIGRLMKGRMPSAPLPEGVPEWTSEVAQSILLDEPSENAEPKKKVVFLEALVFRIEQAVQAAEICEEQAIALADLAMAKTIDPNRSERTSMDR